MVGRWQGAASRSLVMHADPLAAYAYRWLGGFAPTHRIDRWFSWFWRHLRGLDRMFDTVVCANAQLARRLREGGLTNARPFLWASRRACSRRRTGRRGCASRHSRRLGSMQVRRCSSAWVVFRRKSGGTWCSARRGCGAPPKSECCSSAMDRERARLELLADRIGCAAVLARIDDRDELARLLASADALVHGCEAETFCMVAAEARASGIPLIVPDRGAAIDQLVHGAGRTYRAARRDIAGAGDHRVHRPRTGTAARSRRAPSRGRTMDEHFAELFARYRGLAPKHWRAPAADWNLSAISLRHRRSRDPRSSAAEGLSSLG